MKQLRSMSFEELLALKNQVEALIADRASAVRKQLQEKLSQIEGYARTPTARRAYAGRGRRPHALKGRKLVPKYRNPKNTSETWAGRGMMPLWLKALIAKGHKPAEFAVQKTAALQSKGSVKRGRRKKA